MAAFFNKSGKRPRGAMFLFAGRCALFDENACIIMILKDYFFCSANDEINESCGKGKNDCRGNAHRDGFV